jgi:hypothetical protein
MLNVLNSGKQRDIATTLMVRVQLFCGVTNSVSIMAKRFVVHQVASYVYVKVEFFWPFSMCYSIC